MKNRENSDMGNRKQEYNVQYTRQYQRQFMIKVNRKLEPDLVEWLESQENVQAYIKKLVREDIQKRGISNRT